MNVATLLRGLSALPPRMRLAAGTVLACAILGGAFFTVLAHDNRIALFASPLHPEQLSEVQEKLAEWSVPFAPSTDNVTVAAARRSELLLRLSLAGVPHSHIDTSNDRLARVSALTPQSVIEEQTRDGLAGDLELALRGIEGVDDAAVIIAPAKPAEFADEQSHDATASVRLRLHPGAHLSPNAVAGMRSFVAAGVPGLDGTHVTIVDDRGVALRDDGAGSVDSGELQTSLQSVLDSAFGSGSTIVRVHVDYDERAQQITETRRIAASRVPISSEQTDELYNGADRRYSKTARSDDRGSDVREIQTNIAPGRLARISVAIVVDAQRGADLLKIRALATAAAGLDVRRGDTIAVQAVGFRIPRAPRQDVWFAIYGLALQAAPALIVGIIMLFALKVCINPASALIKALATRSTIAARRKAIAGFAPAQVRGALRNEPPHTAAAIISALPAATAAAVLDLYPPEERAAIIRRMSRSQSNLVPDFESVIANA